MKVQAGVSVNLTLTGTKEEVDAQLAALEIELKAVAAKYSAEVFTETGWEEES